MSPSGAETLKTTIQVWTDGACSGNPGPGGWGALLITEDGTRSEISGGDPQTTNNRMELLAAIAALETIKKDHGGSKVTLHTDSTYVKDGLTKWLRGWKANGWKTASKKPVKNQDLWQRLDQACQAHAMTWKWVRGHTGDAGNEHADMLARQAIQKQNRVPSDKRPARSKRPFKFRS